MCRLWARHAGSKSTLGKLKTRLEALPEWNHDNIVTVIRGLAEDENVKPAAIIHPARFAVSGRTMGPSVFKLLGCLLINSRYLVF
ncbi:MAG: hypothetical protein ABI210_14550 [Abditibacteriaceae bacterium]